MIDYIAEANKFMYDDNYIVESLESEKAKAQEMLKKVNDKLADTSHSMNDEQRQKLVKRRSSLRKKIETLNTKILKQG
jgi:phosphate uptake regulator